MSAKRNEILIAFVNKIRVRLAMKERVIGCECRWWLDDLFYVVLSHIFQFPLTYFRVNFRDGILRGRRVWGMYDGIVPGRWKRRQVKSRRVDASSGKADQGKVWPGQVLADESRSDVQTVRDLRRAK